MVSHHDFGFGQELEIHMVELQMFLGCTSQPSATFVRSIIVSQEEGSDFTFTTQ